MLLNYVLDMIKKRETRSAFEHDPNGTARTYDLSEDDIALIRSGDAEAVKWRAVRQLVEVLDEMSLYRPMSWAPDPPAIDGIVPSNVRAGTVQRLTLVGEYFGDAAGTRLSFVLGGTVVDAEIVQVTGVRQPRSTMEVRLAVPASPVGSYQIVAVSIANGYQWVANASLEVTA